MSAAAPTPSRPWLRDVGPAILLGAFLVAGTYGDDLHHHGFRRFDAGTVAILLFMAATFVLRHRRPVLALTAIWGAALVYFLVGYTNGPVWIPLIVAYYAAVSEGHRAAAATAAVIGFVTFPWIDDLLGRGPGPSLIVLSGLAAWLLLVFAFGEAMRLRGLRSAEAARLRSEEARRRAGEERLRIARELHDVLAHNISLINVQAGVALHVNSELPPQARAALTAIRDASSEALGELRGALDALRQTPDAAPRGPAPDLRRIGDLAAGARASGLDVQVSTEGTPIPLPAPLELAGYRIVQEALTNVIRHADASRVWIDLRYESGALRLSIVDDGVGVGPGPTVGTGSGIAGMRERATALGGELAAGPRTGGGFEVVARLPMPTSAAADPGSAVPSDVGTPR